MKVAIIYNKDMSGVINQFGMQNREVYNPETVKKVASALESGGHNVEIIDGNMNVIENLQSFMPKVLEGEKLGMVFNMAYGIQGESRYTHIPSMLEMLGIPYVGSTPSGHALALDKVITKIIMQKHGLSTPEFWVFSSPDDDFSEVIYPVIIKPKMESVSFGLKVAYNEDQLKKGVKYVIDEFSQQALAEQFIPGREFAVGLLGNNPVETFPVLEIDLGNDPNAIQTVDDKQHNPKSKICPANIPEELSKKMKLMSMSAFKALQLRDFSRVDIRMDKENNIYLLEINSMASLGLTGSYVYAANVFGYDYKALVNKMLDVAVVRYFSKDINIEENSEKLKKIPLHVRVRTFLRGRQDIIEKLLKQLVDTNSYVRNIEGVNLTGNLIRKQLLQLGFNSQIIPQVELGNILFFTNSDSGNYDLLFLGNLDNSTKINKHEYFVLSGQRIYGTGVWENKGGIVAMIAALQALKFIRVLRKIKIGILLTTDDTLQGKFAKSIIIEKSIKPHYVFSMHGSSLDGGIVTSRSGAAVYKILMNLKDKSDAENVSRAISVFSKLLSYWTDLSNKDKGYVISPSEVTINSNITEPYAHAEAVLSVRFNDNTSYTEIDTKIRKAVSGKYKNLITLQIEGGERRPAMSNNDKINELFNTIRKISSTLDIRLKGEHRWSSSDISFIENNKYLIDGLGPIGIKNYNEKEFIYRYSVLEKAALIALVLYDLLNK